MFDNIKIYIILIEFHQISNNLFNSNMHNHPILNNNMYQQIITLKVMRLIY